MNYIVIKITGRNAKIFPSIWDKKRKWYGLVFNLDISDDTRVVLSLEMVGILKRIGIGQWKLTEFGKNIVPTFDGATMYIEIPIED